MARTIYLSVRGDGAWRVLEAFRRELGEEAATLVVHPSRDENGFYGSADVSDPAAAREAFARARQPYPTLRAHLSAPPPESEEPSRRQPAPDGALSRRPQPRPPHRSAGGGEPPARSGHGARGDGHGRQPGQQAARDQPGDQGQDRRTARRRRRPAR